MICGGDGDWSCKGDGESIFAGDGDSGGAGYANLDCARGGDLSCAAGGDGSSIVTNSGSCGLERETEGEGVSFAYHFFLTRLVRSEKLCELCGVRTFSGLLLVGETLSGEQAVAHLRARFSLAVSVSPTLLTEVAVSKNYREPLKQECKCKRTYIGSLWLETKQRALSIEALGELSRSCKAKGERGQG